MSDFTIHCRNLAKHPDPASALIARVHGEALKSYLDLEMDGSDEAKNRMIAIEEAVCEEPSVVCCDCFTSTAALRKMQAYPSRLQGIVTSPEFRQFLDEHLRRTGEDFRLSMWIEPEHLTMNIPRFNACILSHTLQGLEETLQEHRQSKRK